MYYLYDPKEKLHTFFTSSLAFELKKQGKNVMILNDVYPIDILNNVNDEDFFIYIIHPIYLFKDEEVGKTVEFLKKKKTKKILYITEPLTLMMDRKNYRMLITKMNIFESWTYTLANKYFLNNYRIRRIAPLYSKEYQWLSFEEKKKNIEKIIFIGNPTQSRMEILKKFGDTLEIKSEGLWDKKDWKEMLSNHIIYLNVHRIPKCPCLETMRITPLLSNGAFIISENVHEEEMNEYKEMNIIFGKREDLFELYKNTLQNWNWKNYFDNWEKYCQKMVFENQWKEIPWFHNDYK